MEDTITLELDHFCFTIITLSLGPSSYDSGEVCPKPTILLLLGRYTLFLSLTVRGIVSIKYFPLNKDFRLLLWLPMGHFPWNGKEHSFKEVGKDIALLLTENDLLLAYGCHIFAKAPNFSYHFLSEHCHQSLFPVEFKLIYLPPPFYFKENLYSLGHLTSLSFFSIILVCTLFPLYSQINIIPPPGNGEKTKLSWLSTMC